MVSLNRWSAQALFPFRSDLGEGVIWDHRTQHVVWIDITAGLIHRSDLHSRVITTWTLDMAIGAIALHGDGGYLAAVETGFALINTDGTIAELEHLPMDPNMRMNDGAVDAAGRFVVGTVAWDSTPHAAALLCRDPDGTTRTIIAGRTISNGVAWSPDTATMYYIDSPTQVVDALDYNVDTGAISNKRVAARIPDELGVPDGMCVDSEGCLWVAVYGGGVVRRYQPDGALIGEVTVDATQVTSCAFAGPKLDTLVITTAAQHLDRSEQNSKAGWLFTAYTGHTGLPATVIPSQPARHT